MATITTRETASLDSRTQGAQMDTMTAADYLDRLIDAISAQSDRIDSLLPDGYTFERETHTGALSAQAPIGSPLCDVYATPCWELSGDEIAKERATGFHSVAVQAGSIGGLVLLTDVHPLRVTGDIDKDVAAYIALLLLTVAEVKQAVPALPEDERKKR